MATVLQPPVLDRTSGTAGLNRVIASAFGVRLVSDVHERLSRWGLRPWLDAKRRERLHRIRASGLLFIHVPKNAGTSISERLYGAQTKHATALYYSRVAPDVLALPSFAIIRNPVERFLSAYRYARTGGTRHRSVSQPFLGRYGSFRSIDDAIDHLAAARSLFDIDHVFRPQAWYLLDAHGQQAVDRLIPYERIGEIGRLLGRPSLDNLPLFNRCDASCERSGELPGRAQLDFLHSFYARDFALRETALKTGASAL
ncbi:sulfotransferase family 2 domain-containing protein [Novosphingobium sp. BL-8A]|uniref:sulfotransferase family 2 domain-containing protein n=1 Tax=Novosphingobium sp. BL-8A TaxID=3127639 RepID=UPI00375799C3